jgi:site-specific DNA-methyltransferase (adenine-specific)
LHPTQKPVELMEFLVKSYCPENGVVLDFTMGSGSTGVACRNTNRGFIGIEIDEKYYNIAKERIEENGIRRSN